MGEITRSFSGERSSIDFVMVNESAYSKYECVFIDQEKLWFDKTDHCMIIVNFKLERRKKNKFVICGYVEYYTVVEENKVKFLENVERAVSLKGGVDSMGLFTVLLLTVLMGY